MDDTISREAAINALDGICDRECEYPKKQRAVMCASCHLGSAFDAIEGLPSAQPATNCSEIPNGSDDTISRQAAIDALENTKEVAR